MEAQAGPRTAPSPEKVSAAESRSNPRICWIALAVVLVCGAACLVLAAAFSFSRPSSKPLLQVMRLNFPTPPGSQTNLSAFVNKSKNTVTYYVTSPANKTSLVLFDHKNGYICYKPSGHNSCYLRRMDARDREAAQMDFSLSVHRPAALPLPNNQTQYYREFLAIVPGRRVRPEEAGEAVRDLCGPVPISWVKKKDGPPKQRLIYLCIDICFPSNICVSICFYYLPE